MTPFRMMSHDKVIVIKFIITNNLKHSEFGKNANKSFKLQQSLQVVLLLICTQTFPNMTELHVAQPYTWHDWIYQYVSSALFLP